MKSPFKLLLCALLIATSGTLFARDIILVENLASPAEGAALIKILQAKFNIPRKIIHFINTKACEKNSDAIMQLCLKSNGEMEILKMNKYVMEQTMGVFLEAEE